MNAIAKGLAWANRAVIALGSLALIGITAATTYDVIARYLFNAPTIWANEISLYLLQMTVFLPMGMLVLENGHLCSTLIVDRLSPARYRVAYAVSMFAVAAYAALLTWLGWGATVQAWTMKSASPTLLAVPLWIPNVLMPIGGLLLLACSLVTMFKAPPIRHHDEI